MFQVGDKVRIQGRKSLIWSSKWDIKDPRIHPGATRLTSYEVLTGKGKFVSEMGNIYVCKNHRTLGRRKLLNQTRDLVANRDNEQKSHSKYADKKSD